MIDAVATTLATTLSKTVFYGDLPDAEDSSLDTAVAIYDFPYGRPAHVFESDTPAFTPYGILIRARSTTQAAARALCDEVYSALLGMGYLAVSSTIANGRDERGRFEAVAEVEAHEVS